jgi:HSP90 family molecular chaperone
MKEDANDYVDSSKMEELLLRYSEFIEFPTKRFPTKKPTRSWLRECVPTLLLQELWAGSEAEYPRH